MDLQCVNEWQVTLLCNFFYGGVAFLTLYKIVMLGQSELPYNWLSAPFLSNAWISKFCGKFFCITSHTSTLYDPTFENFKSSC